MGSTFRCLPSTVEVHMAPFWQLESLTAIADSTHPTGAQRRPTLTLRRQRRPPCRVRGRSGLGDVVLRRRVFDEIRNAIRDFFANRSSDVRYISAHTDDLLNVKTIGDRFDQFFI